MRKYTLMVFAVALFFAIGMMAQTSSGTSGSSSQYPSSSDQSGVQSGASQSGQTGAYGTQSEQTTQPEQGTQEHPVNREPGMGTAAQTPSGSQAGTAESTQQEKNEERNEASSSSMGTSTRAGKAKTIQGCVFRRETDYFIVPTKGQPERISNSGQSVSEHVGHEVKLHGTEQPSAEASATGSTAGGTAGMAANTNTETGSGAGTTGSMAGNTPRSKSSAEAGNREFVVDRVSMVSETCPANVQKNAQSQGMSANPQ